VFQIINPVAGDPMAFRIDVVIRGISNPRLVDVMSNAAVDAGVSEPTDICPVDSILKIGAFVPTFAEKILPVPAELERHALTFTLPVPVVLPFNQMDVFDRD
jgi:hypothetical protein